MFYVIISIYLNKSYHNVRRIKMDDFKKYIGKKVTVTVDRKMGSKHPKWGYIYPNNYGYIPNTVSGDGEELDAYILGVFEPVESFEGVCIAVLHRLTDDDDKLIVFNGQVDAPEDFCLHSVVLHLIGKSFQFQHIDSSLSLL